MKNHWKNLVTALSSEEALSLRECLKQLMHQEIEAFIKTPEANDYKRGMIAGQLGIYKFLIGTIENRSAEFEILKQSQNRKIEKEKENKEVNEFKNLIKNLDVMSAARA